MAPPTLTSIEFQKKYMLALQVDAAQFILDILAEHSVGEDEVSDSLEHLAKGWMAQEYDSNLVTKPQIQRVYELLQVDSREVGGAGGAGTYALGEENELDPSQHLVFVDAFDMPRWMYSVERHTFEKSSTPPNIAGSPASRTAFLRDRYHVIKQVVLRNEHFTPAVVPGLSQGDTNKLTSTKNLLGCAGETFMLLGMLAHEPDGKLCLEDVDGKVLLDMSQAASCQGLITEGCFVLVEGEYTDEDTLKVWQIGHPPSERRGASRSIFGHIDFLGKGATTPAEDEEYARRIQDFPHVSFVVISDLWLDHPKTLIGLRSVLDRCVETGFTPFLFVFCGSFTSRGIGSGGAGIEQYTDNFSALGDLLASYREISAVSHFLFVPGPLDPWGSTTLPRPAIPEPFVARLKARLPRAVFLSNPCRVKFFGQEIVIFREDLMARVLRNLVGVKQEIEATELKRNLVQMVIDQEHLSPLPLTVQPILWEFDHALRLYPSPTALILADKYERYEETYEGCHVFNPGSFIGNSFGFSTYFPHTRRSEESMMDDVVNGR
ncbi:DNA polymerase epsilon subunit B [Dacryopinax primogenitus]|uniref:DNA polymerase epsilon subunit n=1 Tax=Dacryopinax primogenitus (strain DJM 731) TaxID=1858805 RepID=M5GGU6_DACPD|nr:DNA polymerase epsilon subunit B [Dacryopinax primogenitus]EJU06103.1 DNA polymerase epsilon subunit B [Dacryopinax primogenitus]